MKMKNRKQQEYSTAIDRSSKLSQIRYKGFANLKEVPARIKQKKDEHFGHEDNLSAMIWDKYFSFLGVLVVAVLSLFSSTALYTLNKHFMDGAWFSLTKWTYWDLYSIWVLVFSAPLIVLLLVMSAKFLWVLSLGCYYLFSATFADIGRFFLNKKIEKFEEDKEKALERARKRKGLGSDF